MPLHSPALLSAGISAASQVFNAGAQGATNRASRKWNEKMYDRQRQDSLFDWNMQNEYNSPQKQMERLKDAGLNPNLVYGSGADAQSSAAPRSSSPGSYSPNPPKIDGNESMLAYQNAKMISAQTDNLKAQNSVIVQDALLKQAQTAAIQPGVENKQADTSLKQFQLQMGQRLSDTQVEAAKAQLYKIKADTQYTLDQNERAAISNTTSVREAAARILQIRAQTAKNADERAEIQARIKAIQADVQLKQLDINIKKLGIQPGDNMFLRMAAQAIQNVDIGATDNHEPNVYNTDTQQWEFHDLPKKFRKK